MKNRLATFLFLILFTPCNGQETQAKKIDVTAETVSSEKLKKQETTELIKFNPSISFSDFKVSIENVHAKPNLKSHAMGREFRTAIRMDYDNHESLFAGHYTFAYWGCGSPCQMSVLVDRRNGKIYDAPTASVGYKFQKNSRMLIVNPPDSLGYYYKDCPYCVPEIYILNEKTKKFELKK
jgi:hypothetical protein